MSTQLEKSKQRREKEKEDHISAIQARKQKKETEDRLEEERTRRRWERNYSSEDSGLNDEKETITVYYCSFCTSPSLIIDGNLRELPRRGRDKSRVIVAKRGRMCRYMMSNGLVKVIKRVKGFERQYRLNCKQCGLFMAYCTTKERTKGPGPVYIVDGALTDDPKNLTTEVPSIAQSRPSSRGNGGDDDDEDGPMLGAALPPPESGDEPDKKKRKL